MMLLVVLVLTLAAIGEASPNMYLVEVQVGEKEAEKDGRNVFNNRPITTGMKEDGNDYLGGW